MAKPRTFYYSDEINDDFAETSLDRPYVDETYKYLKTNKFNNFMSALLYYGVMKPVLSLVTYFMGVKVVNRAKIKKFKKSPIFIYANHTSYIDAFVIQTRVTGWKRTNIIGYSDTTAIPVVKHIARAAGYLPIPSNVKGMAKFQEAIKFYSDLGQNTLIYPEAHIWPAYTHIRPFGKTSFHYPAKQNTPIIPVVTVYRKSKISKNPKMTLVVGDPIYPKSELNAIQNKTYLRDACYDQMVNISNSYKQYEFNKYVKVSEEEKLEKNLKK